METQSNKMSNVKQVIVIRKDLKMRRGKEIAQGSHASVKWLAKRVENGKVPRFSASEQEWLKGSFAKICLQVNSEHELIELWEEAKDAGLTVEDIVDSGTTEFHDTPTFTCIAIGPNISEEIDKVTGHLKLY
jgi:PTH2 family peptidyl-tRNA hydrolase